MDKQKKIKLKIVNLPYDIVVNILRYTSPHDIIHFGRTCKQFNDMVQSSENLWRLKLKSTVSPSVYEEIKSTYEDTWYNKLRNYMTLQSEVYGRLSDMAVYFYKHNAELTLYDVWMFFNKYFSNGLQYFCIVHILQKLLVVGTKHIVIGNAKPPYTLTEMYYSKVVLRHFIHAYLAIKWIQDRMANNLSPEIVVNFFIQWVDPLRMHTDEDVNKGINSLSSLVEAELKKIHPKCKRSVKEMCAKGSITEPQIISAVSHVLYKVKRLNPVSVANLESMDILKVLELRCGSDVVIAAIYQAVARKFGVNCELVAFPNHMFLEWRSEQNDTVFRIHLDSGLLTPKRTCPFATNRDTPAVGKYYPDKLIHFLISSFLLPLGKYKTWYMHNAFYLLEYLTCIPKSDIKYMTYLPYLLVHTHFPALSTTIHLSHITDEHLKIIVLLSYLTNTAVLPPAKKEVEVRRRTADVKFAVGMVLQHVAHQYTCVVRGWGPEPGGGEGGAAGPPFYCVVCVDQSERYVAQEHLVEVFRPSRLYHLEDMISKEFTHFNGFTYVPNSLKLAEYPADPAAGERARARAAAAGPGAEVYRSRPFN